MKKAIILVAVLLLHFEVVWPDVVDRQTDNFQHVQALSWEALPNVSRYVVIIEENTAGGWVERARETTQRPEVRISLKSGGYRFSVTAFDYFERAGEPSSWMSFTVRPALPPKIRSIEPSMVRLDAAREIAAAARQGKRTLSISGENFQDDSEIMIVPVRGATKTEAIPVDFSTDSQGKAVNISFDFSSLPPDKYDIVIKNPGGLQTSWRNFEVLPMPVSPIFADMNVPEHEKIFFFHEGYAPLIPINGALSGFLGESFYPVGAAVKLAVLPFNLFGFNWGFEVEASWTYLAGGQNFFSLDGHMLNTPICLLIQKRLWKDRLWLSIRGGGGFTMIQNVTVRLKLENMEDFDSAIINTWMPQINGGAAVTLHIVRGVFLDIGVDVINVLSSDDFKTIFLRPMIGLGGKF
jgi:hypothetical protein